MARKRATRRKKKTFTVPMLIALPIASQASQFYYEWQREGIQKATAWVVSRYTGYNRYGSPRWQFRNLETGALPLVLGLVGHKLANKFGLNRAIANAGIPFIRL